MSVLYFLSEKKFKDCLDRREYSGNIEDVTSKEKSKFPQEFFPEVCITKLKFSLPQQILMLISCSCSMF